MEVLTNSIKPTPTPQELKAIVLALEQAWPKPAKPVKQPRPAWRFANRW